ncbi:MAG: hypothetical protein AAFY11_07435 [Cyanobacteria bacterium J06641_5]
MNAYWLRILLRLERQQHQSILGITLVEVIAATVMATLVVAATLSAIVNIAGASRDERVFTETQTDLESAVDFIVEELKEAVFIYNGDELDRINVLGAGNQPGIREVLGLEGNADLVPILVFWKSEFSDAPTAATCAGFAGAQAAECLELREERRTFTFVAYLLDRNGSPLFPGQTRIRRFELEKYINPLTLNRTPNYVDPLKESPAFAIWPYDRDGNVADPVGGAALNLDIPGQINDDPMIDTTTPVLVDFIDDFDNPDITDADLPICQGNDVAVGDADLDDIYNEQYNDRYIRTPADPTVTSFFACVRDNLAIESGSQDTVLYLRGNPNGREGFRLNPNSPTPLPFVETQVVSRGTADKNFNN